MDILNDIGASQTQQIIIPLQLTGNMRKTFTTKIFFFKIILLDHCAHCAIQNQNTLGYNLRNCLFHSYLITLTPNCHSAYLRPITILSYYYAIKPSYRLNIRAMSLRSSFSLIDSRLSYCFLPFAKATTSFAKPFSLINKRTGTVVKPGSFIPR